MVHLSSRMDAIENIMKNTSNFDMEVNIDFEEVEDQSTYKNKSTYSK